jgi:anti-sigma B factor antagonist
MAHRQVSGNGRFDASLSDSFCLEKVQGCAVVVACGEIDLCTSASLREVLLKAGQSSDRIVIDLTGASFLDSTGMGVMVEALDQKHHRQRGTLCLVGPTGVVRKALGVTHLDEVFPIYSSVAEAASELA